MAPSPTEQTSSLRWQLLEPSPLDPSLFDPSPFEPSPALGPSLLGPSFEASPLEPSAFDPSLFDSGVSQTQWAEWAQDKHTPLLARATAGLYAPGSTFKMTVALAALEGNSISPTDTFNCPGFFDLGNARFHCWRKGGHGTLNLRGGLKNSCDVFFYEVAKRVGIDRIAAMAHRLGLGTELNLDLPGVRTGLPFSTT